MFVEKLKLQLFAESGENQEVAELGTEGTNEGAVENIGTEENQSISGEEAVVAEQSTDVNTVQEIPPTQRDFEKDSAYAKIRREAELAKKQSELLARTLQQFGFEGNNPDEVIDKANAYYQQKPIEEVRKQRVEAERMQQEEAQRQAELEFYKSKEIERLMNDDLKKIQNLDPTVKSLDELGDAYFDLIKAGVDAEMAFSVLQQKKQKETKIPPAEVGKVNSSSKAVKDFYSPEEVDKLSEKELEDPKVWERVRKSMTKWK